jgi:SAM-dependent methyltransferase
MVANPNVDNRDFWNELAEFHWQLPSYSAGFFDRSEGSLRRLELEAVGMPQGLRLLHLQCHFGLDTLSWERLGASSHGVDYSDRAISFAKELAARARLSATFTVADVCFLPESLRDFDVVVSTYGVVEWLSDLAGWAQGISRALSRGGKFVLIDTHPVSGALAHTAESPPRLTLEDFFFVGQQPIPQAVRGSYADRSKIPKTQKRYQWSYSLADIFMALTNAGLRIVEFEEFEFSHYRKFEFMEERGDGRWFLPPTFPKLPLMFKMVAEKTV